ncbi:MAG: restriction endonuclease subunit S [Stenotrophobium sp.]
MASSSVVFSAGNVLYGRMRPYLNKVARPNFEGLASAEFIVFPESEALDPEFLLKRLTASDFVQFACSQYEGDRPRVKFDQLGKFQLNLPPRAEQTRIVAKLEELLSGLDAGVAELKAAQKKLARYRQSLLKAAVEGALTADWREQQKTVRPDGEPGRTIEGRSSVHGSTSSPRTDEQETGAELLQRILTERRARWEGRQLAKFQQQGKPAPKDWQAKYPEPATPDTRDLPALPEEWVWATLSQIGWLDRGRSQHRPRNAPHLYGGPYPFVQTGDIRRSDTFLDRVEATYSEEGLAQSKLWPVGTMCITIAANIGKTAILAMEACFPDSVVGFLPASEDVSVRYVEYFMRTAQRMLEDEAPATAQKNINIEILEKVSIPLPPPEEQARLVELLDDLLAATKAQEHAVAHSLTQSTAQRQNLLRAAFAGQLVPQDPNDEPASVLLERIRKQRAAEPKTARMRGRKAKESA